MRKYYYEHLIPRLVLILLVGGIVFSTGGCKNKEKLAQEAAAKEYAEKVDKAIADLEALLNDDGTMPLAEKERRLGDIKSQNLNEPKVTELILKLEAKIVAEKEALQRLKEEEEALKAREAEKSRHTYINDYFYQIAHAKSVDEANMKIGEALKLYASEDVPVLIILHKEGDIVDYDKPTTIDQYLNFVKDQKKYNNDIYNVKVDEYGQITELELIKK